MSTTPGLMYVVSRVLNPVETSDEQYNRFYNEEHLPDVLKYEVSKVATRYKNVDQDSKSPYLALYPLPDVGFLSSPALGKLIADTRTSKTFDDRDIYEVVEFVLRPYEKVQTYEGSYSDSKHDPASHAKTIVVIALQPAEGTDQDFDDWSRNEHLDTMAKIGSYRRTTRYRRVDEEKPRYLAIHEYDCEATNLPQGSQDDVNTPWAKRVLGSCTMFQRDVFQLIQVQGDKNVQL